MNTTTATDLMFGLPLAALSRNELRTTAGYQFWEMVKENRVTSIGSEEVTPDRRRSWQVNMTGADYLLKKCISDFSK
jgi:hypothetical protein